MSVDKISPKNPIMDPIDYWEWRTTIEELENAKLKTLLQKRDLENARLKLDLCSLIVERENLKLLEALNSEQRTKSEYNSYIKKIEEKYQTRISGKVIDPVTFEIRDENEPIINE